MPPSVAVRTLTDGTPRATKKRSSHRLFGRFSAECCAKNTHAKSPPGLPQGAACLRWLLLIFLCKFKILQVITRATQRRIKPRRCRFLTPQPAGMKRFQALSASSDPRTHPFPRQADPEPRTCVQPAINHFRPAAPAAAIRWLGGGQTHFQGRSNRLHQTARTQLLDERKYCPARKARQRFSAQALSRESATGCRLEIAFKSHGLFLIRESNIGDNPPRSEFSGVNRLSSIV